MKIILFEIIHEDAQPAYPGIICKSILRNAGHGKAKFQVPYLNPLTKTPDIRHITNPGGGILAFVKYKLRYGFLDDVLSDKIVEREYRTTEQIAIAAEKLLQILKCEDIPTLAILMELTDNMNGQNPPAHPNHLGEPIDLSLFTGKRPVPLSSDYFERIYNEIIPWTGIKKYQVEIEKRNVAYNSKKEAEETDAFLSSRMPPLPPNNRNKGINNKNSNKTRNKNNKNSNKKRNKNNNGTQKNA
jgi:hypothetical protein